MKKLQLTPLNLEQSQEIYPRDCFEREYTTEKLLLQSAYIALLNEYLNDLIHLGEYEQLLLESEYEFPYVNHTVYSKLGLCGRKNISIRNIPVVEKLSEEQQKMILDAICDSSIEATSELIQLVKNTYQTVCFVQLDPETEDVYEIVYDLEGLNKKEGMNNALCFEICYETQYDEDGNIPDDEIETQKFYLLVNLAMKMETEIYKKTGSNVSVFVKNRG